MDITIALVGITIVLGFFVFALSSMLEDENRAAKISFTLSIFCLLLYLLLTILPQPIKPVILILIGTIFLGFLILTFLPIGTVEYGHATPKSRFDERDVVFSRYYLRPGSQEYQTYYTLHPEYESDDERMRKRPGLYSPRAWIVNPTLLASSKASFFLTDSLYPAVDGAVSNEQSDLSIEEMTSYIKNLAKYYGALNVGIAPLEPYHVYSHNGRGSGVYGDPITIQHKFAIALTVEMDHTMMKSVFAASMETAKQYVEMTRVAVQLAAAIRFLGYSARAHFEGDYQVIAPLVARDAGLGEFGRMSILITPHNGPRVRIAVVTTDLALVPDQQRKEAAVLDFCTICKKCAENCPSRAISFNDRQEIDGALRWRINAEACYGYWNTSGVDCAICIAVCPYSHPNNLVHNLVRYGISRSGFLRRVALYLDDLFYGRKPVLRSQPRWTRLPSSEL